ncbi:MAG: Hsp20/alpha crystallin family protein [Candidatus Azobacteroides sp.]|jgi:HSP20 family protein|nr:Hsp20/alpha crystallin family protein [Candidatus Azobacteroides sp.]
MTFIRKYRPWASDALFNDFFRDETFEHLPDQRQSFGRPALNILEVENGFRVELAAPGFSKEDFKLDIDKENHLTIFVEKKVESEQKKEEKYLRKEFMCTTFKHVLLLPEDADKDSISASYDKGILSVEVPRKVKEEPSQPKNILVH